ncbi:uncharacterized protein LOC111022608 [Momordica charantia]|uniref:Uncharacterized protein LOC111022608 n=1 Tax=Momordica charantia TaxID=3673 RepID=A0A6J1DPG1_MOMCH|nr:uncharacterized protein LOC111022608 [Momordica charantia]
MELEEDKYFKYAFMTLCCCIRGFSSCIRLVLVIDGAHLKGKYKGIIFTAFSVDGNNQIYPIAFGIVDKESDASWSWFLEGLKHFIGEVDGLLFVSDRHVSITKSIREVFLEAVHGICMHHLSMNMKDKFKNDDMQGMFILAAKPKLRYDQMTSNNAESMNAVLSHARALPVTALLEQARDLVQRWFYERRTYTSSRETILTDYGETNMRAVENLSRTYSITPIDLHELENVNRYSLCSSAYNLQTLINVYAEHVYPLGDEEDWVLPDNFVHRNIELPKIVQRVGRRQTVRIPSAGETRQVHKCSRCGNTGDNRKTC